MARLKFATELARTSGDRDGSLDRIEREIDRLTSLVSELLQVTRAENDPQSRNLHLISLSDLLSQLVDDCSVETQAVGCRVQFSVEQDIQVLGDRELLRRAFENVLRNAIRYAPEDTKIRVTLQQQMGDAKIEVRDYGPGVPDRLWTTFSSRSSVWTQTEIRTLEGWVWAYLSRNAQLPSTVAGFKLVTRGPGWRSRSWCRSRSRIALVRSRNQSLYRLRG